jgi:hypothetical protein|tara:strand:- start:215 stop:361 length:147 start_codon:yes stop_codon:yes gene_type:complete
MSENVKDVMARLLAEWLFRDFGILLDEPTSSEIEDTLELYEENLDEKR